MARIHARKKGKSGSKRPVIKDLSFVQIPKDKVEKLIVSLYKEENTKSKIGIILRDTYGVPDVKAYLGKSISQVLEENKIKEEIPEDLQALVRKAKNLEKHLERNKKDLHNKRAYQLILSKIRRLAKYYKEENKLSQKWRYN